jgi:hypothetical protein
VAKQSRVCWMPPRPSINPPTLRQPGPRTTRASPVASLANRCWMLIGVDEKGRVDMREVQSIESSPNDPQRIILKTANRTWQFRADDAACVTLTLRGRSTRVASHQRALFMRAGFPRRADTAVNLRQGQREMAGCAAGNQGQACASKHGSDGNVHPQVDFQLNFGFFRPVPEK